MSAYYNEFDPNAAQWLRELIKLGLIADGEVDDRSILEITPNDLKGFTQCHFFAGIGVWSHALRNAGWSDDRPVWTGSCPCQPFSSAGKGAGVDDERHLWPAFHWLIKQCRPDVVFGEQVAHKAGAAWFDIVSSDLEGEDYACGKIVLPACGLGAPHLRVRQYWVGHDELEDTPSDRRARQRSGGAPEEGRQPRPEQSGELPRGLERRGPESELADAQSLGSDEGQPLNRGGSERGDARQGAERVSGSDSGELADAVSDKEHEKRQGDNSDEAGGCADLHGRRSRLGKLADTGSKGLQGGERHGEARAEGQPDRHAAERSSDSGELADTDGLRPEGQCGSGEDGTSEHSEVGRPGPTNGFWGAADWLLCRDGKWRPVEPGTFPLADESPSELVCSGDLGPSDVKATKEARTMRLKGYGNAIVSEQAQAFIGAYLDCTE